MGKRNRRAAKKQTSDVVASPSCGPVKKFSPNRERQEKHPDVQMKSPASRKITEYLSPSKFDKTTRGDVAQTSTEHSQAIEVIPAVAGLLTPDTTPVKGTAKTSSEQPEKKRTGSKKALVKEFLPLTSEDQEPKADQKTNTDTETGGSVDAKTCSTKQKKKKAWKPRQSKKKEEKPQSSTLTDYFPVRRSNRKSKRQLAAEEKQRIEESILQKKEEGIEVQDILGKGRGVVATRKFTKGEFIVEYAGNLIDSKEAKLREAEYLKDSSIGCYMYYFVYKNKQYCVDATAESGRLGRLINHSKNGNCCTKLTSIEDRPYLMLCASKDIKVGEELLYDYGDRDKESLAAHPWLAL